MRVPFVDLKRQYQSIKGEIDGAIERVIANTSFIMGKEVSQFEEDFANTTQVKFAVGCSSGTTAIHLALIAGGVKSGDEVITVPNTFIATTEAITHAGAKTVFVGTDPETYNLDPAKLEAAITPKTKAVIVVYLYGQPAEMDKIREICLKHDLVLIADAAQAHLAEYQGKPIADWADMTTYSFFPGKNLGAYGDAGMAVTNSEALDHTLRLYRNHGRLDKYEHLVEGYNYRLDALQAAILGAKLPHLASWTKKRQEHAASYTERLKDTEAITLPYVSPDCGHVYHLFVVRLPQRDQIRKNLTEAGIACGVHYPIPLHLQPAYKHLGYNNGDFPHAEENASSILSLPIFAELTIEEIDYVCDTLKISLNGV